ncbi:hypothetical protein TrLO_g5279 [Triparma laevis f. longispina]|nr:hypothetical protein TrLO_g5279 [Triparma laevis f. longispina]
MDLTFLSSLPPPTSSQLYSLDSSLGLLHSPPTFPSSACLQNPFAITLSISELTVEGEDFEKVDGDWPHYDVDSISEKSGPYILLETVTPDCLAAPWRPDWPRCMPLRADLSSSILSVALLES